MQVLLCLSSKPGKVFPRDQLLAAAWPDTYTCDGVLAKSICALRKALGDKARQPSYIETIPKVGYRLMVDVQPVQQAKKQKAAPSRNSSATAETDGVRPNPIMPFMHKLKHIPFQTAAMVVFMVLSGILAFMLFRQPTYMTEEITVLKSYDTAGVVHIDSTVVIRTNLSEAELLPVAGTLPAHIDSTIEVFKSIDLP